MPLIRNLDTQIVLNISDFVIGTTTIKRKAELINLVYSPTSKSVVINIAIKAYADSSDGTYGQELSKEELFKIQYRQLIADNTTLVDANTGTIVLFTIPSNTAEFDALFADEVPEVPEVLDEEGNVLIPFQAGIPAGQFNGVDVMYEFEFYKLVAANQPVIIDQLIISKIQQADAEGRL